MRAALLILVVALAGCDVFSDSLDATLTAKATPPNSVALRLANTGERPLAVGPIPCEVDLEVEGAGGWASAEHEPLIACVDLLTSVAPGKTVEASYPMKGVPNGTYRFRLRVSEEGGGTRDVVSNEVLVVSASK